MTTETVTIGCRLPHGLKLEVGYKTTRKGADGKVFANYEKQDNYQCFVLKGTNEHTLAQRASGIQVPSNGNPVPFINKNVPKDIWEQWVKEHPRNWYQKSMNIFVVTDGTQASADAMVIDSMATQAPLAPLNRDGDPRAPKKTDKHSGIETLNTKD